ALSCGCKPGRRAVERLIPGRWAQPPIIPDERLRQPYLLAHQAHLPDGQLRFSYFTFGGQNRSMLPALRISIVLRWNGLKFATCVLCRKERRGGRRALLSGRTARRRVLRISLPYDGRADGTAERADFLAGEEPLGIRVDGTALTMTMRTPGDDIELAAGFLGSQPVVRA